MEELNQKYGDVLNQCLKFDKFKRFYGYLIKSVKPELEEKFAKFEKTELFYTESAKEQWQVVNKSKNELSFSIKKHNTSYVLILYNKNLTPKTKLEVETNKSLDENHVALLELTNRKTGLKILLEYVEAVDNKRTCLVEKDFIWNVSMGNWTLETDSIYLNEQEINI